MSDSYVVLIDAGFLQYQSVKVISRGAADVHQVRCDVPEIGNYFRSLASNREELRGQGFLRAYWYDGAFDPEHPSYEGQRGFFSVIGETPGIQLRLGHVAERPQPLEQPIRNALREVALNLDMPPEELLAEFDRHWHFRPIRQQKGVDALIALDLVRFASRSICSTAVLVAGDRDLAEAIRTSQDFGIRVLVVAPSLNSIASEVAQLADAVIVISVEELKRMLLPRLGSSAGSYSEDGIPRAPGVEVRVGETYQGRVTNIIPRGVFVEIAPNVTGLVHISEISNEFVENIERYVQVGEEVVVKCISIDELNRPVLSMKQA